MNQCSTCKGKKFTTEYVEETLDVDRHQFIGTLPVLKCTTCGDFFFTSESLYRFELAVAHHLAESGAHSGAAFRFMRKAIGISARELAQLLDVTPETLSRWETSKRDIDRSALAILGSLVLDALEGRTHTIDRLHTLHEPKPLTKSIRISLHSAA